MITSKEYELLKQYRAKGYGWIARSKKGNLYAFKVMPVKSTPFWTVERGFHLPCLVGERGDNILTCVTWKDEEPTKINDLISDYEVHQLLVGESEKVIVPQFIAYWIDGVRVVLGEISMFDAYDDLKRDIWDNTRLSEEHRKMAIKICRWICDNPDTFIAAWRDGYVVEKEKLYIVELPNHQRLAKSGDDIKFYDEQEWQEWFEKDFKTKLTKAEIEAVDPRLMQFAVEVEQ